MTISDRKAFTLVEILVAAGVSAVFLGMVISLFMGFSKSFSVMPKDGNYMTIDENQIKFNVYDSQDGVVKPIIYSAVLQTNGYYNMTRRIANGKAHTIVKGKIASFSWKLNEESISTGATPVKRLGLEINLKMGSSDLKNKSFDFKTTFYPVRANKMR